MWFSRRKGEKELNSSEFVSLSARMDKLSSLVDSLTIENLSLLKQMKSIREIVKVRFSPKEEKEESKDFYKGVLLPE